MASKIRHVTITDRFRYAFDRSMAAGPIALIGWLAVISATYIFVAALILTLTAIKPEGEETTPFSKALWRTLMRSIDCSAVGGDEGWSYRLFMLLVTAAGIFIFSSLISVITSGLETKMDDMRKGRSFVIEKDHTLILGWSSSVFTILSELVAANANQKAPRIVIMADKDKVEMEEEIHAKVGPTGRTRIICRTGSPIDLYDLEIANPHQSKSVIILSPEEDDPDSHVIKSILAITNNPRRREEPYHIVAEIQNPKNMEAARLVGGDETQFIKSNDLIARITVQTCRQSGISEIYTQLLDYGSDDIYFKEAAELVGKTYGDAIFAYDESSLFGLQSSDGRVTLNPAMKTPLSAGDKIIVISEDDDTIVFSSSRDYGIDEDSIRQPQHTAAKPERTLILGWNSRGTTILSELNLYVAAGSEVMVIAEIPEAEEEIARIRDQLNNQTVNFQVGDTGDRATLDNLHIPDYDHVIVLGYVETMELQQADARTLITLLHLRNIEQKSETPLSVVSEMLDVGNCELAEVTKVDDFIVSDKLISLMMAQVSENKHLNAVFSSLFNSEGAEIYLKSVGDYVTTEKPVNFYTVLEAARRRGETAIGYRQIEHANNNEKQYGVVINPKKSEMVSFAELDRIIVVSES